MNRGKDSVRSTVAIIPARGGSKRLAGKNIIEIGGRPMVAWTIDAAIASGEFDRVIVSTDDAAIAGNRTPMGSGGSVPARSRGG